MERVEVILCMSVYYSENEVNVKKRFRCTLMDLSGFLFDLLQGRLRDKWILWQILGCAPVAL